MSEVNRILMVAAENDTLPGAKVGGVGDVIRDLPHELASETIHVDVVVPSYGFLARLTGLESYGNVAVNFAGRVHHVEVLRYHEANSGAGQFILHHELFAPHGETVYCNDDNGPFATDATKFAFFNAALAKALTAGYIPWPNYLHCHDWHAAYILILREYSKEFEALQNIKTVFSIHNIAMQGIRPFKGEDSSFKSWFPSLRFDKKILQDPRYPACINPMRAGILLAEKVHTVSPTYAKEILEPSNHQEGIYGGEGLEGDLKYRDEQGDLIGIINGCEYPEGVKYSRPAKKKLTDTIIPALEKWSGSHGYVPTAHWIAERRLQSWLARKSIGLTVTSIGRLTEQKVRILQARCSLGVTVLEGLSDMLGDKGAIFILGSGDSALEHFVSETAANKTNIIFINGYSNDISQLLYNFGDVFLMPSSFEPCGISQMLAMRAGQPCIVNATGGLKDTIDHNETGFVFEGANLLEQADALLGLFDDVIKLYEKNTVKFKQMSKAASAVRLTWDKAVEEYKRYLYI